MAKIIEVKQWDTLCEEILDVFKGKYPISIEKISLNLIKVKTEKDIHEIAETLNISFIFRKKTELMCTDGIFQFWYKP